MKNVFAVIFFLLMFGAVVTSIFLGMYSRLYIVWAMNIAFMAFAAFFAIKMSNAK